VTQPRRGGIEKPDGAVNIVWQTRNAEPSEYENRLADALEQVFGAGADELHEVVAGLNRLQFPDPQGKPWTQESFQSLLARLGT
jgi:hypothetical protein